MGLNFYPLSVLMLRDVTPYWGSVWGIKFGKIIISTEMKLRQPFPYDKKLSKRRN
jgi:hypothetical protein